MYVVYFRLTTYTFDNLVINLIVRLIAYNLLSKKPAMNIDIIDKSKLIA